MTLSLGGLRPDRRFGTASRCADHSGECSQIIHSGLIGPQTPGDTRYRLCSAETDVVGGGRGISCFAGVLDCSNREPCLVTCPRVTLVPGSGRALLAAVRTASKGVLVTG